MVWLRAYSCCGVHKSVHDAGDTVVGHHAYAQPDAADCRGNSGPASLDQPRAAVPTATSMLIPPIS